MKSIDTDKYKSLLTRLLSGMVLLVCLFFVLIYGGGMLFIVSLTLSLMSLVELLSVFGLERTRIAIVGYIFASIYYIIIFFYDSRGIPLFLIAMLLSLLIFYVLAYPKFNISQVAEVIFCLIYVVVMFSFVYLIREKINYGKYLVWLIFISSWGADTFAYIGGLLFGKHKMSPILSPKKTIEGAISGLIGVFILGYLYSIIMFGKFFKDIELSSLRIAGACVFGALLSMLGDLSASAIKREYNVKDYGNLIPGHGGILDRFDSVIFTAPALYFILSL